MPAIRPLDLRGVFDGIRVIELAGIGPAPYGVMLLADLGADVVRIDRPLGAMGGGSSPSTELLARGRRSIAIDLKEEEGRALARRLVDRADVLVDPFRPGVLERLGFAPSDCLERNPRLVVARMTGWGQGGPLAGAAAHDVNYIALVGALHPIGGPDRPEIPLNLVGDFGGGGMLLAFGIAAALFERERSGLGQVIDVAMVDGVASLLTAICQLSEQGSWGQERGQNWLDGAAPWYHAYRTADGRFVSVGALEEKFYVELLERLGVDPSQWPQWDQGRWPRLREALARIFASKTLAEWQAELEGTDACFAPVLRLDEAPSHAHLARRGTFIERAGVMQPAPVPRFERTPGRLDRPPPWPGQHTEEIIAELGERAIES